MSLRDLPRLNWRALTSRTRREEWQGYEPGKPHPANVPGQFYVEDGCCLSCGVPESIAPDLFKWTDDGWHCYINKQPENDAEFDQMFEAMTSSEADCIRARTCSAKFFERLKSTGYESDQQLEDDPPVSTRRSDHL